MWCLFYSVYMPVMDKPQNLQQLLLHISQCLPKQRHRRLCASEKLTLLTVFLGFFLFLSSYFFNGKSTLLHFRTIWGCLQNITPLFMLAISMMEILNSDSKTIQRLSCSLMTSDFIILCVANVFYIYLLRRENNDIHISKNGSLPIKHVQNKFSGSCSFYHTPWLYSCSDCWGRLDLS